MQLQIDLSDELSDEPGPVYSHYTPSPTEQWDAFRDLVVTAMTTRDQAITADGGRLTGYSSLATHFADLFAIIGEQFALAPASSGVSRHHHWSGGLVYHILEVFYFACHAYRLTAPKWTIVEVTDVLAAAVLHDLNKVCDADTRPLYVPNHLKSGKVSDKKPWVRNSEYLSVDNWDLLSPDIEPRLKMIAMLFQTETKRLNEGAISFALARAFVPGFFSLPDDVIQAIRYHDGGYGPAKYDLCGSESPLQIALHYGDMASSRNVGVAPVTPIQTLMSRVPPMQSQEVVADSPFGGDEVPETSLSPDIDLSDPPITSSDAHA